MNTLLLLLLLLDHHHKSDKKHTKKGFFFFFHKKFYFVSLIVDAGISVNALILIVEARDEIARVYFDNLI